MAYEIYNSGPFNSQMYWMEQAWYCCFYALAYILITLLISLKVAHEIFTRKIEAHAARMQESANQSSTKGTTNEPIKIKAGAPSLLTSNSDDGYTAQTPSITNTEPQPGSPNRDKHRVLSPRVANAIGNAARARIQKKRNPSRSRSLQELLTMAGYSPVPPTANAASAAKSVVSPVTPAVPRLGVSDSAPIAGGTGAVIHNGSAPTASHQSKRRLPAMAASSSGSGMGTPPGLPQTAPDSMANASSSSSNLSPPIQIVTVGGPTHDFNNQKMSEREVLSSLQKRSKALQNREMDLDMPELKAGVESTDYLLGTKGESESYLPSGFETPTETMVVRTRLPATHRLPTAETVESMSGTAPPAGRDTRNSDSSDKRDDNGSAAALAMTVVQMKQPTIEQVVTTTEADDENSRSTGDNERNITDRTDRTTTLDVDEEEATSRSNEIDHVPVEPVEYLDDALDRPRRQITELSLKPNQDSMASLQLRYVSSRTLNNDPNALKNNPSDGYITDVPSGYVTDDLVPAPIMPSHEASPIAEMDEPESSTSNLAHKNNVIIEDEVLTVAHVKKLSSIEKNLQQALASGNALVEAPSRRGSAVRRPSQQNGAFVQLKGGSTADEEDVNMEPGDKPKEVTFKMITSARHVEQDSAFDFDQTFLQIWYQMVMKKKRIYITLLVHIIDTTTDMAVFLTWLQLAQLESRAILDIVEVDMWSMAYCVLASFIMYRVITAGFIFQLTHNWWDVFFQLTDLKLFLTAYVSHAQDVPSRPMRWLRKMEAVLQATPSAILQLVFLYRGEFTPLYGLTVVSFIASLVSMVLRLINDDSYVMSKYANVMSHRAAFRVVELSARVFVLTLFWVATGGFIFSAVIAVEVCMVVLVSAKTGDPDVFHFLVAIDLNRERQKTVRDITIRSGETFAELCVALLFGSAPFSCAPDFLCANVTYRSQIYRFAYVMPIITFFCWLVTPMLFSVIYPYIDRTRLLESPRKLTHIVENEPFEILLDFLEFGANPNVGNTKGATPLHAAARRGKVQSGLALIATGAVVDKRDNDGKSPLHESVSCDHEKFMKLLLKSDADVNAMDRFHRTPLHYAAMFASIATTEALLSYEPILDVEDSNGHTPLELAIAKRPTHFVEFLKEYIESLLSIQRQLDFNTEKNVEMVNVNVVANDTNSPPT